MSEFEFVDKVVVEAIKKLGHGGACCAEVLAKELDFDTAPAIDRLLRNGRINRAPGWCSHCSSYLWRVFP